MYSAVARPRGGGDDKCQFHMSIPERPGLGPRFAYFSPSNRARRDQSALDYIIENLGAATPFDAFSRSDDIDNTDKAAIMLQKYIRGDLARISGMFDYWGDPDDDMLYRYGGIPIGYDHWQRLRARLPVIRRRDDAEYDYVTRTDNSKLVENMRAAVVTLQRYLRGDLVRRPR